MSEPSAEQLEEAIKRFIDEERGSGASEPPGPVRRPGTGQTTETPAGKDAATSDPDG